MEFVNPASLDVRLGNNIMVEVPEDRKLHLLELTDYTEEEPYELTPGEFCLQRLSRPSVFLKGFQLSCAQKLPRTRGLSACSRVD